MPAERMIITDNMNCINPNLIPSKAKPPCESSVFTKRIGSTNYRVSVHFSKTSRETMSDKILRLVKNEAAKP
ncbi:MAG: transposon-encoded TnpW family protein [Oscillospiraceae bacterium]|nr:transposon-encoded TnpW family protein [Oscillospiraceae bacterium]